MYVTLCWTVQRGGRKVLPHPEVLIILNSLLDIINSMRVSTLKMSMRWLFMTVNDTIRLETEPIRVS
jgi:hypothetical protein